MWNVPTFSEVAHRGAKRPLDVRREPVRKIASVSYLLLTWSTKMSSPLGEDTPVLMSRAGACERRTSDIGEATQGKVSGVQFVLNDVRVHVVYKFVKRQTNDM